MTISDLFDYPPARDLALNLLGDEPGNTEFREKPETALGSISDGQVRSIFTEALVAEKSSVEANDVRHAISRRIGRAWARFSQHIKQALAEAEAKKDAGLRDELLQQYLDVQRKMKEFNSFYDEA
jgi:hypothetical protein